MSPATQAQRAALIRLWQAEHLRQSIAAEIAPLPLRLVLLAGVSHRAMAVAARATRRAGGL